MSRKKRRKQQPAARKTENQVIAESSRGEIQQEQGSSIPDVDAKLFFSLLSPRHFLILAIGMATVWYFFLIGMATWSANPVTLNWKQFKLADAVIVGEVTDLSAGLVTIEKSWKMKIDSMQVTIFNLEQTHAKERKKYLMPLSKVSAENYEIVRIPTPADVPVVYPATDDALEQLDRIVTE